MEGGRDPSNLSHSSKQKSRASTGLKPAVYSGLGASKSAVRVVFGGLGLFEAAVSVSSAVLESLNRVAFLLICL